jgi:hypothetical protein
VSLLAFPIFPSIFYTAGASVGDGLVIVMATPPNPTN